MLLRRCWDALGVGRFLDGGTAAIGGRYRPSLMIELWVALLFWGGEFMDDLGALSSRGVRRLFGWAAVPDPTTFGRWLRRGGKGLVPLLDELIWRVVRIRWSAVGAPERVTLLLDSHVAVRYGTKQAGAGKGYNSKKPGRPSHQPLVAFVQETRDCLGVRWRPGSAGAAASAPEWIEVLVARLLSVERREHPDGAEEELDLGPEAYAVKERAHVLTNVRGIHALTAWRRYNAGAVVEDCIEELRQMGAGRTAVDDVGGNRVPWQMAALACQLLHVIRTATLTGRWTRKQPQTLRLRLFRLPAKQTRHRGPRIGPKGPEALENRRVRIKSGPVGAVSRRFAGSGVICARLCAGSKDAEITARHVWEFYAT